MTSSKRTIVAPVLNDLVLRGLHAGSADDSRAEASLEIIRFVDDSPVDRAPGPPS